MAARSRPCPCPCSADRPSLVRNARSACLQRPRSGPGPIPQRQPAHPRAASAGPPAAGQPLLVIRRSGAAATLRAADRRAARRKPGTPTGLLHPPHTSRSLRPITAATPSRILRRSVELSCPRGALCRSLRTQLTRPHIAALVCRSPMAGAAASTGIGSRSWPSVSEVRGTTITVAAAGLPQHHAARIQHASPLQASSSSGCTRPRLRAAPDRSVPGGGWPGGCAATA